jgi:hypothetical protein
MVIEMLPALVTAIRAAAMANDNAPPVAPAGLSEVAELAEPAAPPIALAESPCGAPLVRALRRRPGARYATAGNVILPLAFAERMPGWRAQSAPRR